MEKSDLFSLETPLPPGLECINGAILADIHQQVLEGGILGTGDDGENVRQLRFGIVAEAMEFEVLVVVQSDLLDRSMIVLGPQLMHREEIDVESFFNLLFNDLNMPSAGIMWDKSVGGIIDRVGKFSFWPMGKLVK